MSKPGEQQLQQWTETKRSVPAAALCFNVGAFEFAADVQAADGKKTVPVKLLGRTGKPISHWYWGNVVHDMAGMRLAKDTLPIDYCHDVGDVIGYLDKFETTSGDLVAHGALVPFEATDRATEVAFKSKSKVPYEASINFAGGPLRLEELEAGTSVTVNGNVVQGPALVIREWTLRGIAICPYGADMGTRTEFSAKGAAAAAGEQGESIEVTLFKGGNMPAPASDGKTTDTTNQQQLQQPAGATPPAPDEATKLAAGVKPGEMPAPEKTPATPAPEAKEYIDAFGDVGARWFYEKKSFASCVTEFCGSQRTRITELEAEVKQLKQQIKDMPAGNEAASFEAEKRPGGTATGASGRSKFMASITAARTKNTTK